MHAEVQHDVALPFEPAWSQSSPASTVPLPHAVQAPKVHVTAVAFWGSSAVVSPL
jgi:hypothetical protein